MKTTNYIELAWKIKPILEKEERACRSNTAFIAKLWEQELQNLHPDLRDGNLWELLLDGFLSDPFEAIRVKYKLQETNKSLRDENWKGRHQREAEIENQLTFFDQWNY